MPKLKDGDIFHKIYNPYYKYFVIIKEKGYRLYPMFGQGLGVYYDLSFEYIDEQSNVIVSSILRKEHA